MRALSKCSLPLQFAPGPRDAYSCDFCIRNDWLFGQEDVEHSVSQTLNEECDTNGAVIHSIVICSIVMRWLCLVDLVCSFTSKIIKQICTKQTYTKQTRKQTDTQTHIHAFTSFDGCVLRRVAKACQSGIPGFVFPVTRARHTCWNNQMEIKQAYLNVYVKKKDVECR